MPIESSGEIRLRGTASDGRTDINEEINSNATDTDVSLGTLNTTAFTAVSDGSVITGRAMSEMRGYSAFTSALPQTEATGALGESLYFNSSDEIVYLDRDADFTNTNTTGTFSFWLKRNDPDDNDSTIYASGDNQTNRVWIRYNSSGSVTDKNIHIVATRSGSAKIQLVYDAPFLDTSSWYHVVVAIDTAKNYQYDRVRTYVNGIELKDLETGTKSAVWPSQNEAIKFNNNQRVGEPTWATGNNSNMVIADFKFIESKQLRPDSFGKLLNGIWIPQAFNAASTDTLVTSNLIARYEFNGNANDTSGSATTYNGTESNINYYSTNYGIAKFDGSSSSLTATRSWDSSSSYTIGFWFHVNPGATSGGSMVWQDNGTNQTAVFVNYYGSGSTFQFLINHKGQTNTGNQNPYLFEADGQWHYYVATFNGSQGNLYVDGKKEVGPFAVDPKNNVNASLYLGGNYRYNGTTYRIPSTTGDIQIYDTNLSDAQILQNYNAEKHKYAYGINGFWLPLNNTSTGSIDSSSNLKLHLDASDSSSYSGSGTNWNDLTSNNNDGTISGANYLSSTNGGVFDFDGSNDYVDLNYKIPCSVNFTLEYWFKYDSTSASGRLLGTVDRDDSCLALECSASTGSVAIQCTGASSSSASFGNVGPNDTNWHHWVVTRSGSKMSYYLDGILKATSTGFSSTATYTSSYDSTLMALRNGYAHMNGSLAQFRYYDDTLTAQEVITNYRATQGNYEQVSTVDISGNANSFTSTNIDYTDHTKDEPLDNYATLGSFSDPNITLSEGNLKAVSSSGSWAETYGTLAVKTGKWYYELKITSINTVTSGSSTYTANAAYFYWGFADADKLKYTTGTSSYLSSGNSTAVFITDSGSFGINSSSTSPHYGTTHINGNANFALNDIIGISLDADTGSVQVYKNGSTLGSSVTFSANEYIPLVVDHPGGGEGIFNFGQKPFTYTPPTGYKALSTKNLPAPTFDPDGATQDKPSNYFKAVTYQGTGAQQGDDYGWIEGSRAAVFNGSSSFIQTSLSLNTASNTVSFWFNADSVGSQKAALYFNNKGGRIDITINGTSSNTATVSYENILINSTTAITGWNFVSIVFTGWAASYTAGSYGSAITANVYLNGGSAVSLSPTPYGQSDGLRIGRSGGGYYYDGKIDQVRIYNTALTQANVTTLYEEALDSNISISGLVAHYDMEGDANEANTPTGNIDSGQSAVFNGSSNIIKSTGLGVAYRNQTTLSLSYWIKSSGGLTSTGINVPVSFSDSGDGSTDLFMYFRNNQSKHLIVQNRNNGTTIINFNTNFVIADSEWHHVGFTADSSGHKIYIDGNQITPTYTTGSASTQISMPNDLTQFNIGGNQDSGGNQWFMNGQIDQVRVYSSALSLSDITALTKETGVPTANLDAHYKLDGNGDDATGNYNATSVSVSSYTTPAQFLQGLTGTESNVTYTQDKPYGNIDVGFAPDFVWLKSRTLAASHGLYDSVRGAAKWLRTDGTDAEQTQRSNGFLSSFDSNGFSLRDGDSTHATYTDSYETHQEGQDYVAWAWKGGGDAVAGTGTGVTNVSVSANTEAGFSIVKFTGGSASGQTVGHGLNQEPEIYFLKGLDNGTDSWIVCGNSTIFSSPTTNFLRLNTTASVGSTTANAVGSNGNVINVGVRNYNGQETIAYCFHSVDGFSKIGSYTGNGTDPGPFVYTGFKPAWIIIKRTDSTGNWWVFDNARNNSNSLNKGIRVNLSNTEEDTDADANTYEYVINFFSNGFQYRIDDNTSAHPDYNANNGTYIYMAFAEDPVKYSNGVATLGDGNEFIQDGNYPEDNFATETYTGNGGTQSISSLNFKPDLVWTKSRDGSRNHNLVDSVRGIGTNVYKGLASDLTDEENDPTNNISSLDSNGFTITGGGTRTNVNGEDYVAWSWKAGGLINKSAEFNGSSSKIDTGYSASGDSTFTFSWWMFLTNTGNRNTIISDHRNTGGDDFTFFVEKEADNDLNVAIGNNNNSYSQSQVSITSYLDKWSHFVITISGTSVVIYADGSQIHSFTSTIAYGSANSQNYYLGTLGARSILWFEGKLDQVRIFNKALSTNNGGTNEIEKLYNETAADLDTLQILGDTSCIAAYKLGEDAIDLSGNYNGTASNVTFEKPGHLTRNNKGTIESEVSANQTNGFSIAKYTGSGTADSTVGHGLSKPPEIIIVKNLDNSYNWMVKVPSIMTDDKNYLYLNEDAEIETAGSTTFIKDVLSNTFTLGSSGQTNTLNDEYIAYCWHSVPGFSKIGSYTGSSDEVDVYTGFEPAWVMIKNTDSGANWVIFDNKRDVSNPRNAVLIANRFDDESDPSTAHIDIFSNKFQINDSTSYSTNRDNDKYIYMAFAHR